MNHKYFKSNLIFISFSTSPTGFMKAEKIIATTRTTLSYNEMTEITKLTYRSIPQSRNVKPKNSYAYEQYLTIIYSNSSY
jgi:hypothetical protein